MARLEQELGSKYASDINNAMATGGDIDQHIMDMV